MKTIQEKVKERRLELGLTLEEVANALGVNRSTIMRYETRSIDKMPITIIPPLAKVLKCSPEYLMGWSDDTLTPVDIVFDDYFPLRYSTNLSAGSLDELLDSEPDAIVYVPIKYQSMKKRLYAFKVNGTSMNNIIQDGSIVVVERIETVKNGSVVVAFIDGQTTVKRFFIDGSIVTLMPDSSDKSHKPIMINTEYTPVSIIGRVIWHMNPDDIEKYY